MIRSWCKHGAEMENSIIPGWRPLLPDRNWMFLQTDVFSVFLPNFPELKRSGRRSAGHYGKCLSFLSGFPAMAGTPCRRQQYERKKSAVFFHLRTVSHSRKSFRPMCCQPAGNRSLSGKNIPNSANPITGGITST